MKNLMKLLIKREEWFEDIAIDIGNRYLALLDEKTISSTFELWENGAISLADINLNNVIMDVLLENDVAEEFRVEKYPKSFNRLRENITTYVDDMLRDEGWKIGKDENGVLVLGPETSDKIFPVK